MPFATASSSKSRAASRLGTVLVCSALIGACATYTAAPVDVHDVAEVQRGRALQMAAVDAELSRIAPDYDWQGGEWNPLTLLAAALTSSPEIARAQATLAAARAEAAAARIGPGPTLTLTAEYAFDPPEASNWLYGIASDFLLDRGGRREGRIEAADVAARSAEFDYAAVVWSVRMAVRRAFDKRAVSIREADIASRLVAMRRRQFDAVSHRVEAGEVSRLELDRVRADLSGSQQTELGARAGISRATIDLLAALGLPSNAIDADRIATAPTADLKALPAVAPAQVASSLELRSEILQATAAYDRSEAALRVAVASQYPQVSLGPGYTWERGLAKLPFNLSLTLPTSDRAHATIAAAEARRVEAGKQLEAAVAAVTSSIAQADADYRAAFAALDLVRSETLPTATALARQADVEFDAGAINRADWAASQAGLLTAKLDEITAVGAVLTAEAALEDVLRRPLRPPETVIGSNLFTPSTESDR